ncbi:hypothetical protein B0H16DRAFT_1617856 [Mycena metata]|uniref:Uncharacterized protein n=1 Tax=Mycena metata TaxID=1033252 RepID=A0AAD7H835_9AGAR|nr:hypothetical protein B0H16DRAFT_1617856 [Mycena metata]
MPAHSVSEGVDSAVVAFVSSSCYAPPTTLPPLEPSEWEDLASISPKGAVTRKALRDAHEISGKLAFDYAIIQIVAQSEGLIGKPPGFSTTIQRAVGSEEHLKLILRQVDRDLVVNARVLPGFLQFIGAYLAQVDGDILQLIAWLSPIFQPVLSVASKAYLVSKVYVRVAPSYCPLKQT